MKHFFFILVFWISSAASAETHGFDNLKDGAPLKGWSSGFYGSKGNPKWKIMKDETAPSKPFVLNQSGRATYSWLVKNDFLLKNGFVEVDFKIVSGKDDPEAGLVWRHLDKNNYYYVRANAVEDNVIFYRMNRGKKEVVKEADYKVPFKTWHRLKVTFKDNQIDILIDNKPVISVRDPVFLSRGKVGLFTTADTVASFDNFSYEQFR